MYVCVSIPHNRKPQAWLLIPSSPRLNPVLGIIARKQQEMETLLGWKCEHLNPVEAKLRRLFLQSREVHLK